MRFISFYLLLVVMGFSAVYAQPDSVAAANKSKSIKRFYQLPQGPLPFLDSVALAIAGRQQFVTDSLSMVYLKKPDSARSNYFINKILSDTSYKIEGLLYKAKKAKTFVKEGHPRASRDPWIIAVIIGLFLYTALLNLFMNKDIKSVLQSFYSKNALSQVDKEAGLINSWAFIGLFLLFSLTFGLILYHVAVLSNAQYGVTGFMLFLSLSVIVTLLFALKFLVLKFLGFVFDINRLVSEYIAILNLTYFNIAFAFLPIVICFSLLASQFIHTLLYITLLLVVIIFAWQYLRNSVHIISNIRFHKFYLFIYLCALEICPVLILIKALNINF
ncbi:hypothetical protein BH09BAC6_BH09BAC6_20770 [soil metagenome]|jgi:hypothetical protein